MKIDKNLYKGTIIEMNNPSKAQYEIKKVIKNCRCADPMSWYIGVKEIPSKQHFHLEVKQINPIQTGMNSPAYINWIEFKNGEWRSIFERFENKIVFKVIKQSRNKQLQIFF